MTTTRSRSRSNRSHVDTNLIWDVLLILDDVAFVVECVFFVISSVHTVRRVCP